MKQSPTALIIQLKINTSYETEPYSADHSRLTHHMKQSPTALIIQLKIIIWNRALQHWSFKINTSYETEPYSADHSIKD